MTIYVDNIYLAESIKVIQKNYNLEYSEALSMITSNQDEILTIGFGIIVRMRMAK